MFKRILPARILLAGALLAVPVFVVTTVLSARLDARLSECCPIGDDECHYWDEIASFHGVGLNGGYFVADEEPAPQPWTHFGPHGPVFPVLYGGMARVLGWDLASGPVFNLLVLAAGTAAWLCLVRPDTRSLGIAAFIMLTFWPCLLYIPSMVQETLHFAIAFVLAGLANRAVNGRDPDARSFWPFLAGVALASLLRITWTLVLLPWAVVALPGLKRRTQALVLVSIAVTIPGMVLLTRQLAGGYPNFVAVVSDVSRDDPMAALGTTASHIGLSILQLFSLSDEPTDKALEVLQRSEVLGIILMTAIALGTRIAGVRISSRFFKLAQICLVLAALLVVVQDVLGGILLTLLAAWQGWRNEKPLWPVLLSGAAVGLLYVIHGDTFLAGLAIGQGTIPVVKYGLIALLMWLHRNRVADGIRMTDCMLPPEEVHLGPINEEDAKPGSAAGQWLDPRRVVDQVRISVSVPAQQDLRPYLFAGLNLALTLAVVLVAYDTQSFRDYRVLGPHLLLSLLVLAAGIGWRWATFVAVVNLCFFLSFLDQFDTFHRERVAANYLGARTIDLRPYLNYDPATSPWSNTLLVPDVKLANRVRVSPGIGVSWGVQFFAGGSKAPVPLRSRYVDYVWRVNDRWLSRPTRSRFVLIAPKEARIWRGCRLRLLKKFPGGSLYLNVDFPDGPASANGPDATERAGNTQGHT
jgi:hypothetical protein